MLRPSHSTTMPPPQAGGVNDRTDNTQEYPDIRADVPALARRYQALIRRRAPWDTAWQSLADHFLPTRCRLRQQGQEDQEGPMLNSGLVDATGILAMRTLAAGLQGGLTSPALVSAGTGRRGSGPQPPRSGMAGRSGFTHAGRFSPLQLLQCHAHPLRGTGNLWHGLYL